MKIANIYPANLSNNVCIDTELILTFKEKPFLGKSGYIRVFEYETEELVDIIDLSLPAGP